MILGFGQYDGIAGHQFGCFGVVGGQRHLHGHCEGGSVVAHDLAAGSHLVGIQADRGAGRGQRIHMGCGLHQAGFPLLAQVVDEHALERGLVEDHAPALVPERLEQQGLQSW